MDRAMEHLRFNDIRDLVRACGDPATIRRLKTFYKGVKVNIRPGDRQGKIEDIIPNAGNFRFERGEGKGSITVKVCGKACGH